MSTLTIIILIVGGYVALMVVLYALWRVIGRKRSDDVGVGERTTLEILVPKNNEKNPLSAEQMFAALHGIYDANTSSNETISFEIVAKGGSILFYVNLPKSLKDFVEGQIFAQYPTVEINEVVDYVAVRDKASMFGADITLTKNQVFPIKTFPNFEVDPLAGITGVLAKAGSGEEIWVQIIIRPVPDTWQAKGVSYVNLTRSGGNPEGESIAKSVAKGMVGIAQDVAKSALSGGAGAGEAGTEASLQAELSAPEEAGLKGIEEKVTKLGFETKIRIIGIAPDQFSASAKVASIVGAFKQFNTTNLNGFRALSIGQISQEFLHDYAYRRLNPSTGYILNIEELASIWHLPHLSVETPAIAWAGAKKGEPPHDLPIEGTVPAQELTVFGQTNFRHYNQHFGIRSADRRLHFYAIGKTGTGKSTMLENMIIDDISEGRGVAVVDPHGDLVSHILDYIPKERVEDVIYFSPADKEYPIGFNILENIDPDLKSIVASGVVGIFKKIFGDSWGPRLEYILRNTILSLLDYPGATMLEITRMLNDKDLRKKIVTHIKDPVIYDFWVNEFDKYDQKFRTEAVAPIQNKVGQFLSTPTIRNIVGQKKSTINLREALDNKKILLLDLSVGKIGEDVAALLGAMMITKVQLSAMQRANVPEDQRTDFYMYVDEFQNFATESFATILSEARKYHLNLIMTNQYIAQMPEVVRDAVFGNVGSLVSFRVGAGDAEAMAKEFEPVFDANDLVNLNNYNIYVKMAINGVSSQAFSALTLPPNQEKRGNASEIIEASRRKYSSSRKEVEKAIVASSNLGVMSESEQGVSQQGTGNFIKSGPRQVRREGDYKVVEGGKQPTFHIFYPFNKPQKPHARPRLKKKQNNKKDNRNYKGKSSATISKTTSNKNSDEKIKSRQKHKLPSSHSQKKSPRNQARHSKRKPDKKLEDYKPAKKQGTVAKGEYQPKNDNKRPHQQNQSKNRQSDSQTASHDNLKVLKEIKLEDMPDHPDNQPYF